ncbi:MAG: transketolase [Actinobacteria bacterium]|nr:transketolase [Actinomycetota bacterium]
MDDDVASLESIARRVRIRVLNSIYATRSPHIGSSFSPIEILVALYFRVLKASPQETSNPERDRFILSKGHACPSLYAVLTERGFMSEEEYNRFAMDDGVEQHPNMEVGKGIEVSTGSLGHGLSIGAGMALAGRLDNRSYKVYVLLSDGELNEGSVWEAVAFAGHHGLSNLVALVDANKMQALGHTRDIIDLEPIAEKWHQFRWHTQEIDGHDFTQILEAVTALSNNKPNVIIMHTIKGKGVSFMEDNILWHYRAPDDEEYEKALKELTG